MYNKRGKTDLSLCIKKRMSSTNIKDKDNAETRTNGDKNPVHTYIITQKKVFNLQSNWGIKEKDIKRKCLACFQKDSPVPNTESHN